MQIFMIIRLLLIGNVFFPLLSHAQAETETLQIGTATADCQCKTQFAGDDPENYLAKKGSDLGVGCIRTLNSISCVFEYMESIECPVRCSKMSSLKKLTHSDYLIALKRAENDGRNFYATGIPKKKIYEQFNSKFPYWWPVLVNVSLRPQFIAEYEHRTMSYVYAPLKLENKLVDVGVIFFFKNIEKAVSGDLSWSFWNHNSGELLHTGDAPYNVQIGGNIDAPCFVPAGKNLDETLLTAVIMGISDAGCCGGVYFLGDLKKRGPVEIKSSEELKASFGLISTGNSINEINEVMQQFCGRSSDPVTGKYTPALRTIDGPANLRKEPSSKADLVGSCSNRSTAADLGNNGKGWNRIFCEGYLGWTQSTNLRNK